MNQRSSYINLIEIRNCYLFILQQETGLNIYREQLSTWIVSNFKIVLSFSMSLSWTVVRIIKFAVAWSRLKQYRWFSWTTTSRNENVHSLVLIIYGLFQQMQLHSELIYLFTLTATEHASTFRTAGNEFTVCRCETQKRWNF